MSEYFIDIYKILKQEIDDGYGDDYGIDTYYFIWKSLIDILYNSVKDEPDSLPYIFYEIELATYNALDSNYADALNHSSSAYKKFLKLNEDSELIEELNFRAVDIITAAADVLEDWKDNDPVQVTKHKYELTKKFDEGGCKYSSVVYYPCDAKKSDYALIDYAEALRIANLLDKESELKQKIIGIAKKIEINKLKTAHKLMKILTVFDKEKLGRDIYNKALNQEAHNLEDFIEWDDSGGDNIGYSFFDADKIHYRIKKTEELIELLKKLGRDEEVKYWENRKEIFNKQILYRGRTAPLP